MKRTRFFLMALLLVTVLMFTGCRSKDNNANVVPPDNKGTVQQDLNDRADNLGNDVRRGIDDTANDVRNGVNDINGNNNGNINNGRNGDINDRSDVSRNTADNGTKTNLQ